MVRSPLTCLKLWGGVGWGGKGKGVVRSPLTCLKLWGGVGWKGEGGG